MAEWRFEGDLPVCELWDVDVLCLLGL